MADSVVGRRRFHNGRDRSDSDLQHREQPSNGHARVPFLSAGHRMRSSRRQMSARERDPRVTHDAALLPAAYADCRSYLLARDSDLGIMGSFLRSPIGAHVDAVLAFLCFADDLIDDPGASPEQRALRYREWRGLLVAVHNGTAHPGQLQWSVCRAFVHTMEVWGISPPSVTAYLDGLGADLTFSHFATYAEFDRYLDEAIVPPLAWMNDAFEGVSPEARSKCRQIAAAIELTNILVDLREDLALGRLYLPMEDLERFGVDRHALEQGAILGRSSDKIRTLVLFEAARARALYISGAGWHRLVAPFARVAVQLMEVAWEHRLVRIERSGGELFGTGLLDASTRQSGLRSSPQRRSRDGHDAARRAHGTAGLRTEPRSSEMVPRHVGLIVDGNRRWARANGLRIRAGHARGVDVLHAVIVELFARGVRYLSVYALSTENLARPPQQVNDLVDVYFDALLDKVMVLRELNLRLVLMGRPQGLPALLAAAIDAAEEWTSGNDGGTLAVCMNYGGQAEIVDAVAAIIASGLPPSDLSTQNLPDFLYAPEVPPLDLVIRTGGEQRLSNFMLWRAAYAELAFLETLWPDFTLDELSVVLDDYGARVRRFGR